MYLCSFEVRIFIPLPPSLSLSTGGSIRQTLLKKSVAKVFVTVVEAADLLASNANGKSDPFCVVKLGESQELATPIIMGTLNPRWNHTVSKLKLKPEMDDHIYLKNLDLEIRHLVVN